MSKNHITEPNHFFYRDIPEREPECDPIKVLGLEVEALNQFNNRQILDAVKKLREVQPQTTGAQVQINRAIRELTMIAEGMLDV